jgi:MYXO-CTERM domain-containing protein
MRLISKVAFLGVMCFAGLAYGQTQTFNVVLTGPEEVTAQGGDPNGFASGTVTLNGATNTATWNLVYGNLDPVSDSHIHIGAFGVGGGVVIPFGPGNPGGTPNTLSGSVVDPDVSAALANPANYYVNIHTSVYPAGAVRGQLPEPGALALLGAGALPLLRRRRAPA